MKLLDLDLNDCCYGSSDCYNLNPLTAHMHTRTLKGFIFETSQTNNICTWTHPAGYNCSKHFVC